MNLDKIIVRDDGSYVVNNGMYHVPNSGRYAEKWAIVDAYAKEHPEVLVYEHEEKDPEPTQAELEAAIQKQLTGAIQRRLDSEARKLNYDNCLSVCSYVDTGVSKFDDEGRAFRTWRSAVWAKCYEILAEVKSGVRGVPSEEQLFAELPELVVSYSDAVDLD